MTEDDETEFADDQGRADFDARRRDFFALIGHCVTSYQSVEDYLPDVFGAAIGGAEGRANAIFRTAKGLEDKLNLISAALLESADNLSDQWSGLLARIAQAATARNQIAHAKPVHHGAPVTIMMQEEGPSTVVVQPGGDQMKLHKTTKSGDERVWTSEEMRDRAAKNHKLFGHLIAFAKILRGETPPPHLLEP